MSTTRNGKIARLPPEVREQLNLRLEEGEPGIRLVAWLNESTEVRRLVAEDFGGAPINEQNLTNWRQGGYEEWLRERQVREICGQVANAPAAAPTLEQLATLVVANYLVMSRVKIHGKNVPWREWRKVCHAVVKFRRAEIQAGRLELKREKLAFQRESKVEPALEGLQAVMNGCPEMEPAAQAVFTRPKLTSDDNEARLK